MLFRSQEIRKKCGNILKENWDLKKKLDDNVYLKKFRLIEKKLKKIGVYGYKLLGAGSGGYYCWTRNPARLASTFSTLDDLAPGRIILGIGAWWDPLASKVGIERNKPLKVMREVVTTVRALLADETVSFSGDFVKLDGVELDYVYQERRPKEVPIYIGATGMKMMELTGEIADGVVLNYLVSPEYNKRAMEHLEIGASKAGRSIDEIDRPQLVVCSLAEDRKEALDGARLMVTQYLGDRKSVV